MGVHAEYSERRSVPDFVPEEWLVDFEDTARQQVCLPPLDASQMSMAGANVGRRWGLWRVLTTLAVSTVIVVGSAVSIVWAVATGTTLFVGLIAGFWVVCGAGLAVYVGCGSR